MELQTPYATPFQVVFHGNEGGGLEGGGVGGGGGGTYSLRTEELSDRGGRRARTLPPHCRFPTLIQAGDISRRHVPRSCSSSPLGTIRRINSTLFLMGIRIAEITREREMGENHVSSVRLSLYHFNTSRQVRGRGE